MTQQETIAQYKQICSEEASKFGVPLSFIEIYLIKQLYTRKKKRPLVGQYLKDSPLSKLLRQWNGPFRILNDKSNPTFRFQDGSELAISSRRGSLARYNWIDFLRETEMTHYVEAKAEIEERLRKRLEQVASIIR